jgi:hypothetical protein
LSVKKELNLVFRAQKFIRYLSYIYKNSEGLLTLQARALERFIVRFMEKWRFHAQKRLWKLFSGDIRYRLKKPYKSTV